MCKRLSTDELEAIHKKERLTSNVIGILQEFEAKCEDDYCEGWANFSEYFEDAVRKIKERINK